MTSTKLLRSRVTVTCHARFCRPAGWVTALLSLTQAAAKEAAIAAGCDRFLNKPCPIEDLLQTLVEHLNLRLVEEESSESPSSQPLTTQGTPNSSAIPAEVSKSLAVMPQAWIQQLARAASSLNDAKLENVLKNLPEGHERLKTHISELKNDFRYDLILQMLEP